MTFVTQDTRCSLQFTKRGLARVDRTNVNCPRPTIFRTIGQNETDALPTTCDHARRPAPGQNRVFPERHARSTAVRRFAFRGWLWSNEVSPQILGIPGARCARPRPPRFLRSNRLTTRFPAPHELETTKRYAGRVAKK